MIVMAPSAVPKMNRSTVVAFCNVSKSEKSYQAAEDLIRYSQISGFPMAERVAIFNRDVMPAL